LSIREYGKKNAIMSMLPFKPLEVCMPYRNSNSVST
jgi:hypothetical protein